MAQLSPIARNTGNPLKAPRNLTHRFVTQDSDGIWRSWRDPLISLINRVPSTIPTLEQPPMIELYSGRGKHNKICESTFDLGVPLSFIDRTLKFRPVQWLVNPPLLHVKGKALQHSLDSGYTLEGLETLVNDNGYINEMPERKKEGLWSARKTADVLKVECLELWGDSKDGDNEVSNRLREQAKKTWEVVNNTGCFTKGIESI